MIDHVNKEKFDKISDIYDAPEQILIAKISVSGNMSNEA